MADGYKPAFKPKRGAVVKIEGTPGVWQILSQAPGRGEWWVIAWDDAARATCKPTMRGATASPMRGANAREMSAA
jgi:hypothetical protein